MTERNSSYAFRFEKKWASTKLSMIAWLADRLFELDTHADAAVAQATRPSASMSRLDPGIRKRTRILRPLSGWSCGWRCRRVGSGVSAAAIVLPNRIE
jgi:hypothetical protein